MDSLLNVDTAPELSTLSFELLLSLVGVSPVYSWFLLLLCIVQNVCIFTHTHIPLVK